MNLTRIGIIIFMIAALTGPMYTVEGYSSVRNVISELGAQNTPYSWIMILGFLALGLGIIAGCIQAFNKSIIPFILFGLFMALAGFFPHKPVNPDIEYNKFLHQAHSMLATLAGISISVGLLWRAVLATSTFGRIIPLILGVICFALPMSMIAFPDYQGLIQRIMYLLIFIWLWKNIPLKNTADNTRPSTPSRYEPDD
jgi:hypothetical membrane protein